MITPQTIIILLGSQSGMKQTMSLCRSVLAIIVRNVLPGGGG